MGLSFIDKIQWAAGALLELAVLFLAIHRGLFQRHPLLTVYLGLLVAELAVMTAVYPVFGIRSFVTFYVYWALQALLVMCRGAAMYEICDVLLSRFAGVLKLCRRFLVTVCSVLALATIFAASQSGPRISAIVSTTGRGLELAIISVLLFGLAFCRYYQIEIPGYLVWICAGFGFYSTVQVVNNTFLRHYFLNYFPVWKYVGLFSFDIALIVWGGALWKPLPAIVPVPSRLPPGTYEAIAPQVSSRLRELNARLLEMWK